MLNKHYLSKRSSKSKIWGKVKGYFNYLKRSNPFYLTSNIYYVKGCNFKLENII